MIGMTYEQQRWRSDYHHQQLQKLTHKNRLPGNCRPAPKKIANCGPECYKIEKYLIYFTAVPESATKVYMGKHNLPHPEALTGGL